MIERVKRDLQKERYQIANEMSENDAEFERFSAQERCGSRCDADLGVAVRQFDVILLRFSQHMVIEC